MHGELHSVEGYRHHRQFDFPYLPPMMSFVDPDTLLKELADEATALNINIDGEINHDQANRLPRGSHGVIYKSIRHPSDMTVAIKVLSPGPSSNEEKIKVSYQTSLHSRLTFSQKILREFQRWSKLKHPNVLPLSGVTTKYEQTLSLVTDWMEKGNAHNYVQDRAVDPRPLVGRRS